MTVQQDGARSVPGKVIAVHLSYVSRAEERGRTPDAPSYFFKPGSSVQGSGTVERPAGTELLAYEGEIALIIGRAAHRIDIDEAWDHVGQVTASNDLGIYDYRAADKGSNVRSKGRDGYTPLGPELIDAREVDPAQLRLRTWHDGRLVQDSGTSEAELLFSLPQIVADLAQHMTLQPGDVILTGTPTGSSVIRPGETVEVEVTAPGGLSTGRLATTVISDETPFDPALGSLPAADDKQRAEAWGAAGDPGAADVPEADAEPEGAADAEAELLEALRAAPVATLSAQLRRLGVEQVFIDGPRALTPGTKLVGRARTLRFVALRSDLFASHGGGMNEQKKVFDTVAPGEVIVIEARRDPSSGTLGDILALRAKTRGAAGVVTDGGVRDAAAVAGIGLPVFTLGAHPSVLGRRHVPWDSDIAISCGGATVLPGDLIVGDDDGVIVIPSDLAAEVAASANAQEEQDAWVAEQVAAGASIDGLFPPTGEWKERYRAHRESQPGGTS